MDVKIPEKHKKQGVCYAVTEHGIELPVIDVTHPAFACEISQAEGSKLVEEFIREAKRQEKVPLFVQRLIYRLLLGRSILGRGLMDSTGTFLSGMSTYLMKLGPDNLGRGYARNVDRKIAATLPALSLRLRLRDVARLIADGLRPGLTAKPEQPLHFMNIGGGPAADSLNALILLRREHPSWLQGRKILIRVMDLDDQGPAFGARALVALAAEGGPLCGLEIDYVAVKCGWSNTDGLRKALETSRASDAIVAISSEGALFEYGSDQEIVANLEALRAGTPSDSLVVGSLTRADGPARHVHRSTRISTHPRNLDDLEVLARQTGWAVAQATEDAIRCSFNFRLKPA